LQNGIALMKAGGQQSEMTVDDPAVLQGCKRFKPSANSQLT
jgi:hypothetical protein